MSNEIIVRANPILASNIGGGTVLTAIHGFNLQTECLQANSSDTLLLLTGFRNPIHGTATFRCGITDLVGFKYEQPDFDFGNTVGSEYGFYCTEVVTGTNKYGYFAADFLSGGYPLYINRGTGAYSFLGTNVGIGGSAALAPAHPLVVTSQNAGSIAVQIAGSTNKEIIEVASFTTAPVPTVRGRGSRGTATAPTQTQSGDTLLRLAGTATDNAGTPAQTSIIAAIDIVAAENITTSAQGTKLSFKTCSIGSATLTERLSIDENGTVLQIENRTSDPGSPVTGRIWLRTDL